jgi:hypothetical protein
MGLPIESLTELYRSLYMKKLLNKQLGPRCSYCVNKTKALYRQDGFAGLFACEEHKKDLLESEAKVNNQPLTEADYSTWFKL